TRGQPGTIIDQGGQIDEQGGDCAGLTTPPANHRNKLRYALLGRLLAFGQPAEGLQLLRLKILTHGGKQEAAPSIPCLPGEGTGKQVWGRQRDAQGGPGNYGADNATWRRVVR